MGLQVIPSARLEFTDKFVSVWMTCVPVIDKLQRIGLHMKFLIIYFRGVDRAYGNEI